jgi:hypothetical protein
MRCLSNRCFSPVACGGFGYCRELNLGIVGEVSERQELSNEMAMKNDPHESVLPRCTNPEIDDYPPWLLQATKDALGQFVEGPEWTDARLVLEAIDEAVRHRTAVSSGVSDMTKDRKSK